MNLQLLVATMHQNNFSIIENLNLQSDAVIVNQCDKEGTKKLTYNGYKVLWIDSKERGLSRSRNLALENATADFCVICDEDEVLSKNYPKMILDAFKSIPLADLVVFNINRIGWNEKEKVFETPQKIGRFKTYGSVHITFRLEAIKKNNIHFNTEFGAGSGVYACAEDAIFCMDCHKNKLKMYTYPGVLCDVDCGTSTWFKGYNEKYFYDVGAYLSAVLPRTKHILKWYYPYRVRKICDLSAIEIIKWIDNGIKGYVQHKSYEVFIK